VQVAFAIARSCVLVGSEQLLLLRYYAQQQQQQQQQRIGRDLVMKKKNYGGRRDNEHEREKLQGEQQERYWGIGEKAVYGWGKTVVIELSDGLTVAFGWLCA
jgi:hypothetical protein